MNIAHIIWTYITTELTNRLDKDRTLSVTYETTDLDDTDICFCGLCQDA